jgi:predicted kinase
VVIDFVHRLATYYILNPKPAPDKLDRFAKEGLFARIAIMSTSGLNYDVLATDNIRILDVPKGAFKRPLAVILVGYPESGKTTLARKIKEKIPLTLLDENSMMSFLAPRATIFQKGAVEVFMLAAKTIEQLIMMGKGCIYDGNLKTREQRELLKEIVTQAGGHYILIYIECSKEICYTRSKKHNLAISRGEEKGFILNQDLFDYEVATTNLPSTEESHLKMNCENEEDVYRIITVLEETIRSLEQN